MAKEDRVRALTAGFMDAHRARIVEALSGALEASDAADGAPVHLALLDLMQDHLRKGSEGRLGAVVRKRLAGRDAQRLVAGQIALWTILHRMLREGDAQGKQSTLHAVLALAGDAVDGLIGALIDLSQSGRAASSGWQTLVEMGRTHRELHAHSRITRELLDAHDPAQMFSILQGRILETFHLRSLTIASVHREEDYLEVVGNYPTTPGVNAVGWRYPLSHPDILCDVARTGRMEVIDGWDSRYHEQILQADGSVFFRQRPENHMAGGTAFFVPILVQHRTVGVVATASDRASKQTVLREIERMRPFLDLAGATLSHIAERVQRHRAEEALWKAEERLRQAQKMEAIGRLAGGIAHDFNNLLQVITGFSELLLKRLPHDHALRADIEEIKKAGNRAANLVHQLLAFSRKQVPAFRALRMNEVVTGVVHILRRLIGEDIDLVTALSPGVWRISADIIQVEQVIMNLALNARDAMPQGGRLTIATGNVSVDESFSREHPGVRPGDYATLTVADTGCGMDAETMSHLFEPFFTTKEAGKGTGLGLATVHGIVTEGGGNITVSSEVGRGATFRAYLPRTTDAADAPDAAPGHLDMPCGTETVLLVEDEEMVRTQVGTVLRMCGYRVLEARHGAEALLANRRHEGPIHVMVTDVVMPEMSGYDLAGRLAAERPDTKVIFMSGYTSQALTHHGASASDTILLQKPFTPDVLARKVREVLDEQA